MFMWKHNNDDADTDTVTLSSEWIEPQRLAMPTELYASKAEKTVLSVAEQSNSI